MAKGGEVLLGFWGGYILGGAIFGIPQAIKASDAKEAGNQRVAEVQVHNPQLGEDLNRSFDSVSGLSLDGYEDFSFTTQKGEVVEVCMGQYNVADKVAKVAGPISCTQEIEIARG